MQTKQTMQIKQTNTRISRIVRLCGVYPAAQYLKKRGYTLHQALCIIYVAGGLSKK
jgi:hypothetical protein